MDSLFAKTILLLASLFTVFTGADYIKISAESLTYDFKTNDRTPIYYFLNTENIGVKKVRFDVTSQSNWISVYKEGDNPTVKTSLELARAVPLNFVLEIHPERLPDGESKAKVTVEAIDRQDFSVLELKEIGVTVNKNFKPMPEPEASPVRTETPEITPEASPMITPAAIISPSITPLVKTPLASPMPATGTLKPLPPFFSPSPPPKLEPTLKETQSLIDSVWNFLRKFFLFGSK